MDATYRSDLREVNELNFARFDAKQEQRLVEYDAKWERRSAESDAKWERRFGESDAKWERRVAELETRLIRWMFGLFTGSMLAFAGLLMAVLRAK